MKSTGIRALITLACLALSAIPLPATALLGGEVDAREDFSAVVALTLGETPHCSATKIAPDAFLTAAHCVADMRAGTLDAAFQPGRRIFVSNRTEPMTREDFIGLTLRKTQIHPRYREALQRFFAYREEKVRDYRARYTGEELARRIRLIEASHHFTSRFPDVAILFVREPTASIPLARVDCAPLLPGDAVQLVGYGYESLKNIALARQKHPFGRRHWGTTEVIRVDPVNFYTYGGLMRAGEPSLSPGDSGGPVLRSGRVVGVNGTVYGLSRLDAARSNMSVNLNGLGAADDGDRQEGCRAFFKMAQPRSD
ncbi:trypsin-like peptidase domain-containing protein [Thiocystis violascens]|uniref:V8-like Glu-specific endopeptidase n=1 Tax=Thiocystis violascens (strain ATCC 17096 / DSM 198 / 6111) TaxID=765911 RepID=I3Y882_THIV6|nr:trypsin-like serine protease [Thiocystis violascens]AFL73200.1 V8-like Glu-specific endopeptidase [Thiocystis violascens DSM 198]